MDEEVDQKFIKDAERGVQGLFVCAMILGLLVDGLSIFDIKYARYILIIETFVLVLYTFVPRKSKELAEYDLFIAVIINSFCYSCEFMCDKFMSILIFLICHLYLMPKIYEERNMSPSDICYSLFLAAILFAVFTLIAISFSYLA